MMRREASPPASKIKSPSQGPQFTRSIWTFSATGKWLVTSSAHPRMTDGGGICGNGVLGAHFKNCGKLLFRHFRSCELYPTETSPLGWARSGNGQFLPN